ncbi:MAG: IS5 family transposase ISAcma45 [Chroococcidiopsis sp. SAG 2025]|uniref:IS1182 family transposase n=1 Tax=Chroococcidiopsis sp. SAG 2025 TaxID=171389 RepID=UPI002936E820|nr:IS1182 family transposase [Chroococcidiopsis sp. SAG 2025]MDV2997303.1 IS5 family transposase ISAcma45 [Chroococcidiopsis sp. SAG 2025]
MLQPQTSPVPEQTVRVARAAFPKGNLYITMRDEIGTLYNDRDFETLFPTHGQPAFSPWRLVLICVMQFMEELSDRQAAEAVRSRIDWKYVLALELTDPGFDFSVLCEFRARLIAGGSEQQLLDTLLKQFKERGWLKARGKQRTDSTHVLASIRTLNRLESVGETLRAALNTLATVAADWLCSWIPQEWFDRYGHAVDEYRLPKGIAARKEYAQTIGCDGMHLLIAIYDDETTPQWLRQIPVVEILRQTWVHQYYMENGQVCWREKADLPPAGNRFDSPYDPDARYGNKRSTTWTGYKVHITETCDVDEVHLITNVETTHAHLSDVEQTEPIHEALSAKALLPTEHIVDAGYVDGELLISSKVEHGVDLIGPVRPNTSWQAKISGGYDNSQFIVNWDAHTVTCPQGQTSTTWTPSDDKWGNAGINVKFSRPVCRVCNSRSLCTGSKTDPRFIRLRPQAEHQAIQSIRQQQQTAEWKQRYNRRAGVEGTISQGIRSFGLRRARYIGLAKARLQHIMTAVAINLVRVVAWLRGIPHAKTRTSRFAALAPT